jgi:transcriptional regulator with XRE-family HTH domain
MPEVNESGARRRTLAEKLEWLRALKTPRGQEPLSYKALAAEIAAATNVDISGPYVWELCTGRTTNPKLHHLEAIARYFKVPTAYFTDDQVYEELDPQLQLLKRLKDAGVKEITLREFADEAATPEDVQGILGRLGALDAYADGSVRDLAVRLSWLTPERQQVVDTLLGDDVVLDALGQPEVRRLAAAASGRDPELLDTATLLVGDPTLLEALADEGVRDIARMCPGLSEASQRAVITMIEQLRAVEQSRG